jgi:hypothetical protein
MGRYRRKTSVPAHMARSLCMHLNRALRRAGPSQSRDRWPSSEFNTEDDHTNSLRDGVVQDLAGSATASSVMPYGTFSVVQR